ncbi:MAG: ATP-binding protein [Ruthenibacterium sp.]
MKNLTQLKADVINLALPIGFAMISEMPELNILFANERFTSMLGFADLDDFLARYHRSGWSYIFPEDVQRLKAAASARTGHFDPYEISYRAVKKDGSLIWVNQNSQHILDETGTEIIFAYYTDITAQKKMEADMRAGVEQYEMLVNSVPGGVGMYHLDELFTPIFVSDGVYDFCNMTRQEYAQATRRSTLDIFHPDDRAGLLDAIATARAENRKFEYAHRVLQKDGSYHWMRVCGKVTSGQDGTPVLYTVFTDLHEQVQTERALRESEARYAAAIKSANINIWEYDYAADTMTIFSTSPKIHPDELTVRNYKQDVVDAGHISEESAPVLFDTLKKLENGAPEASAELWVRNAWGDPFWCERIIYTNAFDEAGKPVKAYCVGRDITREKEAEKRYRDELSYREAMQKATMASINVNLTQNTILDCKSIFPKLVARMKAAQTVQDYFDQVRSELATEEMQQKYAAIFQRDALLRQFSDGKTTLSVELTRKIDGRRYWTILTVHMMKKEDGDVVAFLYSTDITGERTLQQVMNAIAKTDYDFLVVADVPRNTSVRYTQKNIGDTSISESDHFVEESRDYVRRFVCPEEVERVLKEIETKVVLAQLDAHASYHVFYAMPNPEGGVLKKQLRFSYIDRELKSMLMTRVDITSAVEEQEKKNQALTTAVQMAEHANAAKSEFLSRISHELRTPMNAIMGMNQLISQRLDDPAFIRDCVEKSQYSSQYLLQLLGDILDMSKIEAGKITLKTEAIACQPFLDSISTIVGNQAAAKGVRYRVTKFEGCKYSYLGDGVRLEQILINILTNAIKFTPPGGTVCLDIGQVGGDETTARICFTISDTGIGISPDFLPNLFKPFAQEHSGTRSGYGGSGLGLAISKNLAELMQGDILVESTPGVGTTFRVELPFGIPENCREAGGEIAAAEHPDCYDFSGKNILLVEDHPLNVMVAKKLLEFKNAGVEVAENGQIGLDKFSAAPGRYDAVLMDIRMPVMDGLECAAAIRRLDDPWARAVPIIAMSANAFEEDVAKSKSAGMNTHLAKPIEGALLYETLQKLLESGAVHGNRQNNRKP